MAMKPSVPPVVVRRPAAPKKAVRWKSPVITIEPSAWVAMLLPDSSLEPSNRVAQRKMPVVELSLATKPLEPPVALRLPAAPKVAVPWKVPVTKVEPSACVVRP